MHNEAERRIKWGSYYVWVRRDVVGSLARPRRRWENDIQMDIKEIGCGGMRRICLAQDRG
jgi:hypothetical protein